MKGTHVDCELPASPGGRLTVEIPNGMTVRVTGWDRPLVSVRAETRRTFDATAEHVADGVRVRVRSASGWNGTSNPDMVIRVPTHFDVHAESDNGGVEIRRLAGTFTGATHGGGLVLEEVRGTVRMSTGGGGATLTRAHLDGHIEMRGGGVRVENSSGDVRFPGASSVNGDNDVPASAGIPRGAAAAGGVFGFAAGSAAAARPLVIRRSGPIDVREAPDGSQLSTSDGWIRVGRAGHGVNATTARGDVTIESLEGSATIVSGTGDVLVRVADGGGVDATSAGGTVTIYLPAGYSGELDLETAYVRGHAPTRIVSDFPVALTESDWDTRLGAPTRYVRGRARLGGGRHRVHVSTVHGDVRILRADADARR